MTDMKKAAKATAKRSESPDGWTDDERAAMKERAKELKAAGRRTSGAKKPDGEADVRDKIAEMPTADRVMAERIHALVKEHAPTLTTRTWYGMPAYYKDGKILCFFQSADKFKARYATFGFDESANLDDGAMWPTSYAVKELTPVVEARIVALVKQAVS